MSIKKDPVLIAAQLDAIFEEYDKTAFIMTREQLRHLSERRALQDTIIENIITECHELEIILHPLDRRYEEFIVYSRHTIDYLDDDLLEEYIEDY